MAWTKAQQAAIDQRESNILVSAAAGSGKTAVLTERVVKRVMGSENEPPVQIDRFLIVTFTSAAANEMKERIAGKLSDQITSLQESENAEDLVVIEKIAYLERQIALLQTASISTIHSFCLKVIKAYFNTLGIDPNIKVGSQAELSIMKREILEELIEEKFEEGDEDFLELADVYGNIQGLLPLVELILDIHSFSKSTPFPEMWLDEKVEMLLENYKTISETPWGEAIKRNISSQVQDLMVIYNEAIKLCEKPNGPELYKETLEQDSKYIKDLTKESSLESMIEAIGQTDFVRLTTKKQECDQGLKERVKNYRDLAKDVMKSIQADILFIKDEKLLEHIPRIGKQMKTLVALINTFEERYMEAKQEAGVADYNDLEHFCMQVLLNPIVDENGKLQGIEYTEVAKELSQFYEEVYIDEYQDSNTVQETILKAVAEAADNEGATRFMVGDMKQSIYRFRLANPLIFADKYENFEKYSLESKEKDICIDLSKNFRSRENILAGVNDLFKQLMSKEVGELEYDEFAELKVGNSYADGHPEELEDSALASAIELHLLETQGDESDQEESQLQELKKIEAEAIMVAELVDQVLKGNSNPTHIFDKEIGAYRKVEARDIVILLRATKDKADLFETALLQKGIGAYADVSSSFFEAMEIQTMISLLKIIDNPMQDIPLITVLRSPIVGVSLDDLVYIRKTLETGSFYEALEFYLQNQEAESKIKDFYSNLMKWRDEINALSLEELLSKLYVETGYYRYVSMLATGAKKKANLRMLRKYAEEFETSSNGKLFSFVQYLDELKETSEGLEEAKIVGEDENLVRIMSIHKSKGLEFSVVFLCNTDKKFNNNDIIKNVLMHNELGLAPDYRDTDHHVKYTTLPKIAVKNQIISENISEEMRVLYVALTRAKEKLFITGVVSDFEKKAVKWSLYGVRNSEAILPLGVKKAGCYLNWIGLALYAHPQLGVIREKADDEMMYQLSTHSNWSLKLWHFSELESAHAKEKLLREENKALFNDWDSTKDYSTHKEEIYRRLNFEYKYLRAVSLPTKLSVSEIKKANYVINSEFKQGKSQEKPVPNFIKQEEVKGARRGTLIHSIFEQLDYLKYRRAEEIIGVLQKLVNENKIDEEAAEVVSVSRLESFSNSSLVERMRCAKKVWKEKQFVYLSEAHLIDENYPEDEEILIQGVIDAFFIEEDGVVIIDYKTDYVDEKHKEKSIERIKNNYSVQLDLYQRAIEQIMNVCVKEKWIYLYSSNDWIKL